MNENLKPKTLTINQWLAGSAQQLADIGISSALLDAEIILAHTLHRSRTWLHARSDDILPLRYSDIADARLELRTERTPIAYIIGHKEFYGRTFSVTPSVLIPRPESESIIVLLKKYLPPSARRIIDIGTGSGCLGITAKLELPHVDVTLADISRYALVVAERNAELLKAEVTLLKSDLFSEAIGLFDVIIANLPYVDSSWDRSPETSFEPALALFVDDNGTALIRKLLKAIPHHLASSGIVIIEADPEQHSLIIDEAKKLGLNHVETEGYAIALRAS